MFLYWAFFALAGAGALQFGARTDSGRSRAMLWVLAVAMMFMIGLRYHVGGDWEPYLGIFDDIAVLDFPDAMLRSDVGYSFLNWAAIQLGVGIWLPNLVCGALFMVGVTKLCVRQPNPFLGLLVAIPYLVIVVAMGYTRQAAAIGLVCYGLAVTDSRHIHRMVIAIVLATLMHKTAILALPIIFIPAFRRNILAGFLGTIVFAVVFWVGLRGTMDAMLTNYVEGSYDSSGAMIRVIMNILCAALYLPLRKRYRFDDFQENYWTTSSVLAVFSLVALVLAPSSTGIDRLALFLIPLQIVILTRLPYIFGKGKARADLLACVMIYCAAVQAVWLFGGVHAQYWVPYRSFIGVWLGDCGDCSA